MKVIGKSLYKMSQEGKVAFITGGLGEIGLAIAENLLKLGAKVALVDIRDGRKTEEDLRKKYGEEKVMTIKCDVTDIEQLRTSYQKTLDMFGELDLVVNCAGVLDEVNFERMIQINLTSVITSSYMAVERMRKDGGGRGGILINVSSLAGMVDRPYMMAYSATKAGTISFGKSLVANLGDSTGIKVGTVCPIGVDTALIQLDPNLKLRQSDVTQPNAQDNLARFLSHASSATLLSCQRVADAVIKYMTEKDLHGSTIAITDTSVHYMYPDSLNGKNIVIDK